MRLTSPIMCENQNGVVYGCRVSTRIVRQPPILKVTELQFLTLYSNKYFNLYLFSNAEGKTNQISLFNAIVIVHYVNVKPLIFDVICLLNTAENKKLNSFNVNRKPSTHCIEDKRIPT